MEDSFLIRHQGEVIRCDRFNTMANTYLGELAIYNHVYIDMDVEDPDADAIYVFKGSQSYYDLIKKITELKFMALINQPSVPEYIQQIYIDAQLTDLNKAKGVPPEWT